MTSTENPTPHQAMRRLDPLLGTWEMWALDGTAGPCRTTFRWVAGGALLEERAAPGPDARYPESWAPHLPFPTLCLTGYDDSARTFTTLYTDGRGVARVYRSGMDDGVWTQWREAPGFHQRFRAVVGADRIEGAWERSEDGGHWQVDFDVRYVRAADGGGTDE